MKDIHRQLISFILAISTCFSFEGMLKLNSGSLVISNSIISIVIFVIAYMFYYKYMLEIKEKRLYIISVVLGFIFSFFMVCGSNIIVSDCTLLNTPETLFFILSGTPLWSSGVMFLLENIDSIQVKFKISKLDTWFERVMKPKKMFVFAWLFVFF